MSHVVFSPRSAKSDKPLLPSHHITMATEVSSCLLVVINV